MRRHALALSITAMGLLAGCGGSDDSSTTSTGGITRAEYIARADKLCARYNAEFAKLNQRIERLSADQSSDDEKLRGVAPILREAYERSLDGLDELSHIPVPAADKARIKAFISARERQTALLGKAADAARDVDAQKFSPAMAAVGQAAAGARSTAQGYGFKECGSRS